MEEKIDYIITVQATEDIQNTSKTRVVASKGRRGVLPFDFFEESIGKFKYVDVKWEGNKTYSNVPAWKLEIVDKQVDE